MKKINKTINKTLVIGILILFIGTGIMPSIAEENTDEQKTSELIFYTFDRTGTKKCKAELSTNVAEEISLLFDDLKEKITNDPNSDETHELKNEFVDLLDRNGLISKRISKDHVLSLLKPRWKLNNEKNPLTKDRNSDSGSCFNVQPAPFSNKGTSYICSIVGGGHGLLYLPLMFPRPRLVSIWSSVIDAQTMAANLVTGRGFVASGPQIGMALGFMGVGISFAIPGQPASFGFGGYALVAFVGGDDIETYPLNQEPIISEENPPSGTLNVPVSLSELSFRLSDPDRDSMSYTVTTNPDIGGGEGSGSNGVYTVPVSGLDFDKSYSWTVRVSDGEDTVEKTFSFITTSTPPFDPFEKGWDYRKKVEINHSLIDEDLFNYPVLINLFDSDLAAKAQYDGDDILFMETVGVANKIYHEIEKYDGSTGELIAWANIPKIFSEKDTTFYIYYGNTDCNSQQIPSKTWDSHYKAVYHMNYNNEGLIDSTLNNIDCTSILGNPNYQKMGKIGYAIDFNKSNGDAFEGIDIFDGEEELTVEAWINLENYHPSNCIIASHEDAWYFYISYQYNSVIFGCHGGVSGSCAIDNIECPLNTWYCVAGSWNDHQDRMRVYGNGILKDTYIETLSMYTSPYNFAVGYQDNMGKFFDGMIDEIRISDIERSENWIKTTYINQNNPLNFLTFGIEETN
jgi:hypothetical protein